MPEEFDSSLLKFRKLPDAIRVFLVSSAVVKKRLELLEKYQLNDDQWFKLTGLLNEIYIGDLTVSQFANALLKLGIAEDKINGLVLDFAGNEFLPISSYLGDVSSFIRSLGGNPNDYSKERIIVKELKPQEVVTEFLHEHPVNVPAFLEHRLREILESRVREVRKDPETIVRLTRAEKIGGAELPQEEAERLVEALASKIASVKIAPDVEVAPAMPAGNEPWTMNHGQQSAETPQPIEKEQQPTIVPVTANYAAATIAATASAASVVSIKGDSFMPQDEHEAEAIRQHILPKVISSGLFDLEAEIKIAADAIFAASGVNLPVNLKERYRTIIVSRLKGVRDFAETQDLLVREPGKGGLGFGSELADRLSREIEEQAKTINNKRENAIQAEKQDFVKQTINNTFAKDESRRKGESEELDRMYSSLTGRLGKKAVSTAPTIKNQIPNTPSVQQPTTNIQQPITPVPVPQPAPQTPAAQIPAPPVAKVVAPPSPAPLPHVAYKPQNTSARLATDNSQLGTRMHDVRAVYPSAPLTGPAEELKNMTILDFRRLSSDPVEACRKLTDKLDVLEEQSYGRRIDGIKAWKESEVYKLYLQIINAAFSGGKPIAAAIADAQTRNAVTLTEREVHAIMELNRQLKA